MKQKNVIRALALGSVAAIAAAPVLAQSNVTIYGVVDAYLQYGKGTGSHTTLESGGLSGSRLGFKGTEDLGGGLKALFQIEHGLMLDTGIASGGSTFWNRQAWVGLSNEFGTVSLGRQYVPHFFAVDAADPFSTGAGSAVSSGIVSLLTVRAINSAAYASPKFGPFTFSFVGALGEGSTGKLYNFDGRYVAGALEVGASLIRKENYGATETEDATIGLVSAAYDFKSVKVMGGFQVVKNPTQLAATDDDRREFFGGVQVPLGAGVLAAGAAQGKTRGVSGTKATQYSVGYDHFLSKRTDLYVVGSLIQNGDSTDHTAHTATGAGPATTAGQDVQSVAFGIRHRF